MSDSGIRLPTVKVSSELELAKAETRLNKLIAGLSEELREQQNETSSVKSVASSLQNDGTKVIGSCARCREKIESESEGCNALGENFHRQCFHCNQCGGELVNREFIHSNNRVYCNDCFYSQEVTGITPSCSDCFTPIKDDICIAMGRRFHTACFKCSICATPLAGCEFRLGPTTDWELLCFHDWGVRYAPRCGGCRQPILPLPNSDRIECFQLQTNAEEPQSNSFYHYHCYQKE